MGGELEKKTLEEKHQMPEIIKSEKSKKGKGKNKKEVNDSVTTDTIKSNQKGNRGGKKKKEKLQVVAKDKGEKQVNYEKKVLELIHDKNPAKENKGIDISK